MKRKSDANIESVAASTLIRNLRLSDINKERALRYYELSRKKRLNKSELSLIEYFWALAVDDNQLDKALSMIDDLDPPCLEGKELLSDNEDMLAYISEHLPFLVEEKLKQKSGKRQPLYDPTPSVTLFCPSGDGMYRPNANADGTIDIDGQTLCPQCGHKLSEHRQRIKSRGHQSINIPVINLRR